jgi:hypothetical protein
MVAARPPTSDTDEALVWSAVDSTFYEDPATLVLQSLALASALVAGIIHVFLVVLTVIVVIGPSDPSTDLARGPFVGLGCCLAASTLLLSLAWLLDRRLVVEIRLIPADPARIVVVRRVSGAASSYPIAELTAVTAAWSVDDDAAPADPYQGIASMTLALAGRRVRCRAASVSPGWRQALAANGVRVHTQIRGYSTDRDVGL